jgi:hypothetical protein
MGVCMRFLCLCILVTLVAGVVPVMAEGALSFRELVLVSDKRASYVSTVVPGIASHCMEQEWGNHPPLVLRDWLSNLMLSDLQNRARVLRGEISKQEAENVRENLFFSLEHLQPDVFATVATYARISPETGFGPPLFKVLDCQYRSLAKALGQEQQAL